jgi:predicted phosphodiesterase
MHWIYPVKFLFYLVLIGVFVLPIIFLCFAKFKDYVGFRRIAYILIITGVLLNVLIWLSLNIQSNKYDGSPVLLVSSSISSYGVSDYSLGSNNVQNRAVVVYTAKESFLDLELTNLNTGEIIYFNNSEKTRKHIFLFSNLTVNTKYKYEFPNHEFKGGEFRTLHSLNDSLRIAFASDFHFAGENTNQQDDLAILKSVSNNSDFFIFGGDLTENGFKEKDWVMYLNNASDLISSISSIYLPGNHDTMFGGDEYYYRYLTGTEYYTIQYLAKFIKKTPVSYCTHYKLNDFTDLIILYLGWGEGESIENQLNCMNYELYYSGTVAEDNWVIVASHTFFFSSGSYLLNKAWDDQDSKTTFPFQGAFVNYGVDFVLSGHNHHLEYMEQDNLSYIIAGGSGSKKEPIPDKINDFSKWFNNNNSGFVELNIINKTDARVIFKDVSGNELFSKSVNNIRAKTTINSNK